MTDQPNVPNRQAKKPGPPGPLPAKAGPSRNGAKPKICSTPQQELEILIRARYPIIYLVSWEEERVEQYLSRIAQKRNKKVYVWTFTQGLVKQGSEPSRAKTGSNSTSDPLTALDTVLDQVEPAIYLFKDFHPFMEDARCN